MNAIPSYIKGHKQISLYIIIGIIYSVYCEIIINTIVYTKQFVNAIVNITHCSVYKSLKILNSK